MANDKAPILCPVDGSESARRAATYAANLAMASGHPLVLVGVLDLVQLDPEAGFYVSDEQLDKVRERFKKEVLDFHVGHLPKGASATTKVLEGPVTKTLLHHIDEAKPFCVVVGRSGKGAVERLFQGSVSRALAGTSTAPLTIVP